MKVEISFLSQYIGSTESMQKSGDEKYDYHGLPFFRLPPSPRAQGGWIARAKKERGLIHILVPVAI